MPKIELNIDKLTAERQTLADFLATPDAYSDSEFQAKNRRFTELEAVITKAEQREVLEKQLLEARELATGSDELAELAKAEVTETEQALEQLEEELFVMLTPRDPNDDKNVIV